MTIADAVLIGGLIVIGVAAFLGLLDFLVVRAEERRQDAADAEEYVARMKALRSIDHGDERRPE